MKRKSWTKIVKRVNALLIALALILTTIQVPAQGAIKQDYGSITLSDIILAWYNASGVAIGNTQIANAIQSAYGDITLDDLVDAEVLYSDYIGIEGGDLKEMIGYGNLSAPLIKVNLGRLRDYLPDLPTTNVAYNALNAMFTWENSTWFENNLGAIIGTVANIGKIAYSVGTDILNEIVDFNLSLPWQERVTLRDIYRNFTDSTYFQDLLDTGSTVTNEKGLFAFNDTVYSEDDVYYQGTPIKDTNYGIVIYRNTSNGNIYSCWVIRKGWLAYFDNSSYPTVIEYGVRAEGFTGGLPISDCSYTQSNGQLNITRISGSIGSIGSTNDVWKSTHTNWDTRTIHGHVYVGNVSGTNEEIVDYARLIYNRQASGEVGTGVTDYINKEAGNITESNYSILSPNINVGEYMYLADGATYIETLNQITNNTDNGDYSQNGDVITNYNNTYIQNTMQETRPTVAPAQSPIPAQPFISPRPTQPPESYEAVIHQGGIPETIKQKFPFCIPWDLAAVLQNLWAPEARAPYIHWDAIFGSWGKLGEVDLDFSIFNDAARIFRATTLILWIIGLVVITRNIIGG